MRPSRSPRRRRSASALSCGFFGLALLGLCAALPARADDSSAAIGAGGITFQKNDKIVMEAEQLDLGMNEVRIRFVFRNTGTEDIDTVVAFPLPDIPMASLFNEPVGLPRKEVNFVGFSVTADGVGVKPETAIEATVEQEPGAPSVDVTDILAPYLRSHGPGQVKPQDITKAMLARAKARGVTLVEGDGGSGYPTWTLHTKFYWKQRFPAGKIVELVHRYEPILGAHYASFETDDESRKAYCVTPQMAAEADRRSAAAAAIAKAKHKEGAELAFQTVELAYVLKTGANWNGPIKDFKLSIDVGDPDMLVATCFPGVTRTGPTAFGMSQADLTPTQDIAVAFGRINWTSTEARQGAAAPHSASSNGARPFAVLSPAGPMLIPDSDKKLLTAEELSVRGPEFLRYARNEIFARHGHVFEDKALADWFARFSWYSPKPGAAVVLNEVEKQNVALLEAEEKKRATQ
jgi:hypothetical protein